jgi:small nuclear ribonucleoprotein D3
MSIGIPIKLLHEAEGHVVTIELKTGEVYRGRLEDAEDNMNCKLSEVTATQRDGSKVPLQHVFIRGSHIRFMILPDILKDAPMFRKDLAKIAREKSGVKAGKGRGRGNVLSPSLGASFSFIFKQLFLTHP